MRDDILNVGVAHQNLGNDVKAETFFREALKHAIEHERWADAASANTNIGNVLAGREHYKQAITTYEKSLAYLEREAFDNTEMNTRAMLLQVSELDGYDVERSFANARTLCERYWNDLAAPLREGIADFVNRAVERYLDAHPQKNATAWKKKSFPMIYA